MHVTHLKHEPLQLIAGICVVPYPNIVNFRLSLTDLLNICALKVAIKPHRFLDYLQLSRCFTIKHFR